MRNKRVILDTNLWISFLISKRLAFLDDFIFNGKIKLVFSNELIKEFIEVVKRQKTPKREIEKAIKIKEDYENENNN